MPNQTAFEKKFKAKKSDLFSWWEKRQIMPSLNFTLD